MKKILFYVLIGFISVSCVNEEIPLVEHQATESPQETVPVRGMQSVKLQDEIIETIDNKTNELSIPTGNAALDEYLHSINAYKIQRIFPYGGKYEDLQAADGLNAWYTVWYNTTFKSATEDATNSHNDVVEFVEPVFTPRIEDFEVQDVEPSSGKSLFRSTYNDPGFSRQWNLYNEGVIGNYQLNGENIISSITGADINILPAWEEETGNPEVIVAVVDGGIDIYHEDLKDNLWINSEEIPDNGIDDDDNGYIDDIHGFNFVKSTGAIEPENHGTHVAGVIAAKNNNGKGVSGIAGGNGAANSGVKLMSCQMFIDNPDYDPLDPNSSSSISTTTNQTAAAIVYGANNGAVISQNSWGYDPGIPTPRVIKEAVEYFTKHAGQNSSKSLMKGGLVVFAAANDHSEMETYPAAEPDVISVAAYAPDFSAAWYTNYGKWVDISAPGGSDKNGNKYPNEKGEWTSAVYSTICSLNGQSRYGYMQGTSMACPHVSGIAALIVSKFGGPEFNAYQLKRRLLTSVKKINPNNFNTSEYYNKLGKGYIDAQIGLLDFDQEFVPTDPLFVKEQTVQGYASISLTWKRLASEKDEALQSYILYFSKKEITPSNYWNTEINQTEIIATSKDILTHTFDHLESGTKYYFAIQAFSRSGKSSGLIIYEEGISTLTNTPPQISSDIDLNKTLVMAGNDVKEVIFNINDKENHLWDYLLTYKGLIQVEQTGNVLKIQIPANKFSVGSRTVRLTVTDEFGASSSVELYFKIEPDNPPKLIADVGSVNVHKSTPKTLSLNEFVEDEDKSSLRFSSSSFDNINAQASLSDNKLTILPQHTGKSILSFTVTDKHNQELKVSIPIIIFENEGIYNLYPTLASGALYVRLGDIITGDVRLSIRNVMGKMALEKNYHTRDIDPQKRTLLLNVHSLFPGKYELSIVNNGKTYKESFVKE
ncbi:S8 family serine peptidase [Limibacterium fermenti]|jgi:subtilisin family serine protease|uniref:S8 family serine peptidase n=1 Tax=Limibacterium fermenti TaxID=3229863 RepID=UPI003A624CD7